MERSSYFLSLRNIMRGHLLMSFVLFGSRPDPYHVHIEGCLFPTFPLTRHLDTRTSTTQFNVTHHYHHVTHPSIMTNSDRFSQASTLVEGDSDRDTTLSSQTNSNPQHSTPARNSVNSHRTDDISRSTAATRTRHEPDRRPPQASGPSIMNRRTISRVNFADRMPSPVSLDSNSRAQRPDTIPEPRVDQSAVIARRRRGMVLWQPRESSTKHE
jgi:hypothetical protein